MVNFRFLAALGFLLVIPLLAVPAKAQVYDLTNDFSLANNPNGVWSYRFLDGTILPFVASRVSDPWGTPQPAWGDVPGWFKSNGTELFAHDWIAGDVITHSSSIVVWTSPSATTISISGATWATRDIGRFNDWGIFKNGTLLSSGTIGSGDPFSRSNPHDFAIGTGGAAALTNILVSPGDTIQLKYSPNGGSSNDYAGVRLTITTASVSGPEPGTLALLVVGGTAVALRRRKFSAS